MYRSARAFIIRSYSAKGISLLCGYNYIKKIETRDRHMIWVSFSYLRRLPCICRLYSYNALCTLLPYPRLSYFFLWQLHWPANWLSSAIRILFIMLCFFRRDGMINTSPLAVTKGQPIPVSFSFSNITRTFSYAGTRFRPRYLLYPIWVSQPAARLFFLLSRPAYCLSCYFLFYLYFWHGFAPVYYPNVKFAFTHS